MNPLAAKIIYVVGYWITTFAIRAPHVKVHRRTPTRSHRQTRLDTALLIIVSMAAGLVPLLYVFSPLLAFADYSIPLAVGVAGVAILILGNWIFWKSHRDLGRNWSPKLEIREGHALVTTGIYRRIRHPMYSAIWLLVIGQAMVLPNYVAGFSGLVPFAALYFLRVGNEERMMLEEFGTEYRQYSQRTGRLLPKINKSV
ncbi:MAG: isoprenylcysteine carboxylmethyltransferase family protein [Verrucomicrobia bacterium]|nr:isoprenylcysteine carboxylmethyltransferase family protein [Verrucomicrobiota bacterium]